MLLRPDTEEAGMAILSAAIIPDEAKTEIKKLVTTGTFNSRNPCKGEEEKVLCLMALTKFENR